MSKNIALDCDGVLLDYLSCYKTLYEDLFNTKLKVVNPNSYSADKQFNINWENREKEQIKFYDYFAEKGWKAMKAIPGAVQATQKLKNAGYNIFIVTSIPFEKAYDRGLNLQEQGVIFDDVIACGNHSSSNGLNIKKPYLDKIKPDFFADDLVSNFKDVSQNIKCVLIDWNCENNLELLTSPSKIDIFSTHEYLSDFTNQHI